MRSSEVLHVGNCKFTYTESLAKTNLYYAFINALLADANTESLLHINSHLFGIASDGLKSRTRLLRPSDAVPDYAALQIQNLFDSNLIQYSSGVEDFVPAQNT